MSKATEQALFALLLLICAALIALDWRREGEIELLRRDLDQLVGLVRGGGSLGSPGVAGADGPAGNGGAVMDTGSQDPVAASPESQAAHPLVRAALQAHTDGELSSLGAAQ